MKCLHIQLQPELFAGDAERLVDDLTSIANNLTCDVSVNRGDDNGPYINIDIQTADVAGLWRTVSQCISSNPDFASCAVVCCEGDEGWNDYLLLHHYDCAETLDALS